MTALVTNQFRIFQAENFIEAFSETSPDNVYLFFGRSETWSGPELGHFHSGEGVNYTSAPTVSIDGGGFSSQATATCDVKNGAITGFTITDAGTGYTSTPTVSFSGGGGTGAAATASLGGGSTVTSITLTASNDTTAIPTPIDTTVDDYINHDEAIAFKKVAASNISHVIKRVDWITGTVYDQYEHFVDDIFDRDFFVLTDDNNVYKCIDNNEGGASTVKPTGESTSIIFTGGDNYQWKFMYHISTADALKFLTTDWVPVKTIGAVDDGSTQWDVEQNAVDGAIDMFKINDGGSGYLDGSAVTTTGDGTGVTAEVDSVGAITKVLVTAPGSGYRNATVTAIADGSNGELTPIIGPVGGHGSNAVEELGGFFVMVNVDVVGDEGGDFPVTDDFRQVGLLLNPLGNGTALTGSTYKGFGYNIGTFVDGDVTVGTDLINMASHGLALNDRVMFSTDGTLPTGLSINTQYHVISDGLTTDDFKVSATQGGGAVDITAAAGGGTHTVHGADIDQDTGKIIYVENRRPINRASDQTESVKLVIQF